jgi:hypothetical protein
MLREPSFRDVFKRRMARGVVPTGEEKQVIESLLAPSPGTRSAGYTDPGDSTISFQNAFKRRTPGFAGETLEDQLARQMRESPVTLRDFDTYGFAGQGGPPTAL